MPLGYVRFNEKKADAQYDAHSQIALIEAGKTPEEIISAIKAALEVLIGRLWQGDKPKWLKIIIALPEIAAFLIAMYRSIKAMKK